jgi:hypothetical protein
MKAIYKVIVEEIKNLNWASLNSKDLQSLMVLSWYSAVEFAESLRITINHHAEDPAFREMAKGELKTGNLSFDDYHNVGDHSEFLKYFIVKYGIKEKTPARVIKAGEDYLAAVRQLPASIRIMSIVSREAELPGIFSKVLGAKDWSAKGLDAFRYYLETHIAIDSAEGGHADLLKEFEVNDDVAIFYRIRLDMYRSLEKLL